MQTISALADKILSELSTEPEDITIDRVSENQAKTLRHRLKGIYADLKDHPALMERRLHVGSQKPSIPQKEHFWVRFCFNHYFWFLIRLIVQPCSPN